MYNLPCQPSEWEFSALQEAMNNIQIASFKPLEGVTIAATEEEAKNEAKSSSGSGYTGNDIDAQCDHLLRELPSVGKIRYIVCLKYY